MFHKTRKPIRKLVLQRETVRALSNATLAHVAGGEKKRTITCDAGECSTYTYWATCQSCA